MFISNQADERTKSMYMFHFNPQHTTLGRNICYLVNRLTRVVIFVCFSLENINSAPLTCSSPHWVFFGFKRWISSGTILWPLCSHCLDPGCLPFLSTHPSDGAWFQHYFLNPPLHLRSTVHAVAVPALSTLALIPSVWLDISSFEGRSWQELPEGFLPSSLSLQSEP